MSYTTTIRVTTPGGLLGLFITEKRAIDNGLAYANEQGLRVRFVQPEHWNFILRLLATAIKFMTLKLYYPKPGYLIYVEGVE